MDKFKRFEDLFAKHPDSNEEDQSSLFNDELEDDEEKDQKIHIESKNSKDKRIPSAGK